MKKILITLAAILAVGSLSAQSIVFRIENNRLSSPGTPTPFVYTKTNFNSNPLGHNLSIYSGTVNLTAFNTYLSTIDKNDPAAFLASIKGMESAGFVQNAWQLVPIATGPAATNNDFTLSRPGLVIGSVPVLLITTQPLANLTTSDFVGLVSSSAGTVQNLTTHTVTFGSATTSWNVFHLGTESAGPGLQLEAIPEPSTYAAIFGLLALGAVIVRRRLKK